jgi:hypothetical protein
MCCPFLGLLMGVVAVRAERLKICGVKKQGAVAAMRLDMIDDCCGRGAARPGTAGIGRQELGANFAPGAVIATVMGIRPATVGLGAALRLASAAGAIGDHFTA